MIQLVKLNNPLMGTETIVVLLSLNSLTLLIVKLNNRLMGTETHIFYDNTIFEESAR